MKKNINFLIVFGMSVIFLFISACSEDADPLQSVSHPLDWNNAEAENFHGAKVLAVGAESCQSCHGLNYQGGESGVACADCHSNYPHPEQWVGFNQPLSHDTYIASNNWSFEECTSCHGLNYLGGSSGVSCAKTGCHEKAGGPKACNNCHGISSSDVSTISSWAPPEDLSGNINTTDVGVGAHQIHLTDTTWSTAYNKDCGLCHQEPTSFSDPNHIDSNPGRNIQFGDIATNSSTVNPEWESGSASCENVYCHGNFILRKSESENDWAYNDSLISGNNPELMWTMVDGTQDACGTCHDLPPLGHINITTCYSCHGNVVDTDNNIIDKSKHINGQVDLKLD
jgi:hypothetical protein